MSKQADYLKARLIKVNAKIAKLEHELLIQQGKLLAKYGLNKLPLEKLDLLFRGLSAGLCMKEKE